MLWIAPSPVVISGGDASAKGATAAGSGRGSDRPAAASRSGASPAARGFLRKSASAASAGRGRNCSGWSGFRRVRFLPPESTIPGRDALSAASSGSPSKATVGAATTGTSARPDMRASSTARTSGLTRRLGAAAEGPCVTISDDVLPARERRARTPFRSKIRMLTHIRTETTPSRRIGASVDWRGWV